jgi:AcrR family transcriptional regulator
MPRAGLDSRQVVDAAAELIDREGANALSLSALAQRLGVRSPSLYVHVDSLEDLRRRLATRAAEQLGDVLAPAAVGLSRGAALRSFGHAYRTWALAHPGLYGLIESAGQGGDPAVARVLELMFAVLRGYGLEGDEAVHAARSVRAAVHGFVQLEAAVGFGIPIDPGASFEWMLAMLDRGLTGDGAAAPAFAPIAPVRSGG